MNPIKAQIKIALGNTLGADIEDIAEQHEKEQYQAAGGIVAAKQAVEAVRVLLLRVTQDLSEEKITAVDAEVARLWVGRAVEAVLGVGAQKEAHRLIAFGQAKAAREIMAKLKADLDEEQARLDKVGVDSTGREHLETPAVRELAARKKPAKQAPKKAPRTVRKRRGRATNT